jgi:CheY-like chemotaxis protein
MKPHVLVVDDDAACRLYFGDLLELVGCDVERVASGVAALVSAQQRWPALVLMDVRMPGLDGIETIKRLRSMQAGRALTVLVATASLMSEEVHRLDAVGYDALLPKPLKQGRELMDLAAQHLKDSLRLPPAPAG